MAAALEVLLWLQFGLDKRLELQMMGTPMMSDMWVWLFLLAATLILAAFLAVYLFYRPSQRTPATAPSPPPPQPQPSPAIVENPPHAFVEEQKPVDKTDELRNALEIVRPTVTEDERRILNEIVEAGGEILQSDLPEKSDFSKATVSRLIKSLETMGIVTREKHKWTYWVRISDKLISRTRNA